MINLFIVRCIESRLATISIAPTGVVLNAPVIQQLATFCIFWNLYLIHLIPFHFGHHQICAQYVIKGITLEMYILCLSLGLSPLDEFPSKRNVLIVLISLLR